MYYVSYGERTMLVEINLKLPEELVRDAHEFGLLEQQIIAELLQAEVDHRVNNLVNEEIHAYRTEECSHQKPEQK